MSSLAMIMTQITPQDTGCNSDTTGEYVDAPSDLIDDLPTPTESIASDDDDDEEQLKILDPGSEIGWSVITGDDAPEPGSIYIISETDSSKVLTNRSGRISLTELSGDPEKTQKWVCHRSDSGWLGFANDAGDSTKYLGHDPDGILICTAGWHSWWEHFCVRKRGDEGFDIMVRHWFGMQPLGYRGKDKDGGTILGKKGEWDTWWGFTKVD